MSAKGSLCVAAELKNLAVIRNFAQERATELGIDPGVIADLLLAADEAATNVIVHGYRGQQGMIEIEVAQEAMEVVIRLRDDAPPFDPTSAPSPDLARPLEERPIGGLGIYLIRQYMDEVIHRVKPQGGNELILRKEIVTGRSKP
jgi:serine/threonine-protein kinase RsbW